MNTDKKLVNESNAAERNAAITFAAFWSLNALTTFLFGMQFVSALYRPILSYLPLSTNAAELIAAVAGGLSALIVLDIAYRRWYSIRIEVSQTAEQFRAATIAQYTSFVLSLAYTAVALFTVVFVSLVSTDVMRWLDMFGALSFVSVCILHLVCWHVWNENRPENRERSSAAKAHGDQLSERLAYQDRVMREALLNASNHAADYEQQIAEQLGRAWGASMVDEMTKQLTAERPSLPPIAAEQVTDFFPNGRA